MALSDPIQIRLSPERLAAYEAEAAALEIPLSQFIRDRLETADQLVDEMAAIRKQIEMSRPFIMERTPTGASPPTDTGVLLEILLLTRQRANPQDMRIVQAEVARNGLKVWGGK